MYNTTVKIKTSVSLNCLMLVVAWLSNRGGESFGESGGIILFLLHILSYSQQFPKPIIDMYHDMG